jgi:NhaA family Na+:H+ antiporter
MSRTDPGPGPRRVSRALQELLSSSAAGAGLLLVAVVVALIWANSPFRGTYVDLWSTDLVLGAGRWAIREDLRHWMNDGLMTLFFLLAGLEIRRELTSGELQDRRRAVLPVLAALGGMVVPALLYLVANAGHAGIRGWGMAMPTDLALVVGVLALASPRVPTGLKAFVVSLAIADDVGTIGAVLFAYSHDAEAGWALVSLGVVGLVLVLRRAHIRWVPAYVALGGCLWLAMRAAGLTPTLAGVAMGLLAPSEPVPQPVADEEAPPLARAEHLLLLCVNAAVLPLFALANAGVELSAAPLSDPAGFRVAAGLTAARLIGKVVGIVGVSWLAVRAGVGRLPTDVRWPHLVGVGALAGMGFTVSLFVSELAFGGTGLSDAARMGVLLSSVLSGAAGLVALRWAGAGPGPEAGHETGQEAGRH